MPIRQMKLMDSPILPLNMASSKGFSINRLVHNRVLWPIVLIVEVLMYSSFGVLVNLSREDGKVLFESASLVLNIEAVKLFLSILMAWPEYLKSGFSNVRLKNILPFCVPAICYCLNNNLCVYMQEEMDPASYQVLCNLKIASTALLYRIIMKRQLSTLQWTSLFLLVIAGCLNGFDGMGYEPMNLQNIFVTASGLLMALLYCCISGFAGVFTEYILKKDQKISLHFQNIFLYSFGILLNFLIWNVQSGGNSFFHGYSKMTWLAILFQALNGLLMSLIMKYSSNIVRLFIISAAIPVATVLSMFVFQLQPGITFLVVITMVVCAIYMYNYPKV